MKAHTRRAIAYIAGRLVSKADTPNIYDNTEALNYSFSGPVSKGNIATYDHSQKCEIRGTPRALFHYGNAKYIDLNMSGNRFKGFDGDSNNHFRGTVEARAVTVYDPDEKRYFSYWV